MHKIKKELVRFLIAGFSAVGTDLITYYILINFFSHAFSKAISFIAGTIIAYFINKYWTFEKHIFCYKEVLKFILLYLSTLFANVSINELSLNIFPNLVFIAFLSATATSTILNFIGQKWWVFKN